MVSKLLLLLNLAIYGLSRVVILMTLLHFLFTTSIDHAKIISIALISMYVSEIYLKMLLKGQIDENK